MPTAADPKIRRWLKNRIGAGVRLGLSTCEQMLERLGNPQSSFPSIHVAGTNGKGSLCANLSALGAQNGLLVGLFTSPHLILVEERVRIDGMPIEPAKLDLFLQEVREASNLEPKIHPTYFEATFLASMLAFADAGIDRAVIETGLGGRLDSTRLVEADLCVITTISLDHTEMLGNTVAQIASEKAGIHREGVPLVCLHHEDDSVRHAIESIAGHDAVWVRTDSIDAQGVSKELANELGHRLGWGELDSEIRWTGRTRDPVNWLDVECQLSGAHNAESLAHDLRQLGGTSHVLILGMTHKEDLEATMTPLSDSSGRVHSIVTQVNGGRKPSTPPEALADGLSKLGGPQSEIVPDPFAAMDRAAEVAKKHGCGIFVTGSIYLVGAILAESARRDGSDIWTELVVHPPRSRTEG